MKVIGKMEKNQALGGKSMRRGMFILGSGRMENVMVKEKCSTPTTSTTSKKSTRGISSMTKWKEKEESYSKTPQSTMERWPTTAVRDMGS